MSLVVFALENLFTYHRNHVEHQINECQNCFCFSYYCCCCFSIVKFLLHVEERYNVHQCRIQTVSGGFLWVRREHYTVQVCTRVYGREEGGALLDQIISLKSQIFWRDILLLRIPRVTQWIHWLFTVIWYHCYFEIHLNLLKAWKQILDYL